MREIRRDSRGGDKVASLGPGTHVCLLYHSQEEHQAVLTEYLRGGLDRGERVLCVGTASDARQIRKYLRAAGFDPRDAERRDQLQFLTPDEAYVREGAFDPQAMIALLREETQNALEEGYSGLRVTGEMSWALQNLAGSARLTEYEALLNEFFPGSACTGLCQYDTRRFPPETLLDVLRTHPVVVAGARVHENPFYIPTQEFLRGATDEVTLDRWLEVLEERGDLLASLREHAAALAERVKELSCIAGLRELATREDLSLGEMLEAALPVVRSAWQWPELAQVRIELAGRAYATPGFAESPWRQVAPLVQDGVEVGRIEVAYPDPPPEPEPFLLEEAQLLTTIAHLLSGLAEIRRARDKLRHRNAVLQAIGNVNQLIVRERDRGRLIQRTCELLVETRGYLSAWIALWDEDGTLRAAAQAGLGNEWKKLMHRLRYGEKPGCAELALAEPGPVLIPNTLSSCGDCPLASWYQGRTAVSVRLECGKQVYGVLAVSVPSDVAVDEEEQGLIREVAGDVAFALRARELEDERCRLEQAHRALVEHSLQGLAILQDGRVVLANPALARITGYSIEEILALSPEEVRAIVHPEDRERVLQAMAAHAAGQEFPRQQLVRFLTKDGAVRWIETSATGIEYHGRPALQVACTDITERKAAEDALRTDHDRLLALFDSIDQAIYVTDPATNEILFVNRHLRELLGHDPVGGLCYREFQGRDAPCDFCTNALILKNKGEPHVWEYRNPILNRDYLITDRIIRWPDGRDVRFELAIDITKQKHAQGRQAHLLQRLDVLHRLAQELVVAGRDPEQVYGLVHRAVAELMSAEAFVIALRTGDKSAQAVYLVDEAGRHPAEPVPYGEGLTWHVLSTGRAVFISDADRGIPFKERRFGSKKKVRSILAVPLRVGGAVAGMLSTQSYRPGAFTEEDLQILEMLAAYAGPALENARLLAALREREARFRRLAENAPDVIYRYRLKPKPGTEYVSPASTKVVGYTPEEHYADPELGMKVVHPDDRPLLEALRHGEGTFHKPLELRWIRKDGQVVWIEQINIPVYDEKGELVAVEGIARDITDRKRAEQERLAWTRAVEETLFQLVDTLGSAMELRDPYTAGHQRRVAELACAIARELGLPDDRVRGLRVAALLHDLGKALFVPTEILSKPGELAELEMALIREHPKAGYDVLKAVRFPWPVAETVYQHHERLDGSGYPRGLRGEEILLEARIVAVADVVEAMASHRPYRPAHPLEKALNEVRAGRGTLFDPAAVDACVAVFDRGFSFPRSGRTR